MQAKSHSGGLGRRFLLDRKLSRDGIRHIIHIAYGMLSVEMIFHKRLFYEKQCNFPKEMLDILFRLF
jgi:hypothetical protein